MAVEAFLARLEKVRPVGPLKWSACCPSHPDKTPSLAVREMPDGRVLIHCFGGCSALDVVGAVGLELRDLMPERLDHHIPPVRKPWTGDDALRALTSECATVAVALADVLEGRPLTEADMDRLIAAGAVLETAMRHVDGLGR